MVAVNPPPMARQMPSQMARQMPSQIPHALATNFPVRQASLSSPETAPLSAMEQAALSEIRRKLQEGAEIVCIIRSRTDPTAQSEVITLDRASPNFLRQLAGEALTGDARHLTSLAVPPKNTRPSNRAVRTPSFGTTPARNGGWQRSGQ
jgi:hypothetical protein